MDKMLAIVALHINDIISSKKIRSGSAVDSTPVAATGKLHRYMGSATNTFL